MDLRIVASALTLSICACSNLEATTDSAKSLQLFKNYALSTCVSDGYSSQEVVSDAAAAARGYLEFGDLSLEAYTEATLLGRGFLKKGYKSKHGAKLTLMKCIDFKNSDELLNIYKSHKNT